MKQKPLDTPPQETDGHATLAKAWGHFRTITRHKVMVGELCFKVGLYKQGFMHDWSKYSPTEFMVGARYYQGYRSPNAVERMDKGVSLAWLHHKGRNKHHFEYWNEPSVDGTTGIIRYEMPIRYVIEMFCDRIAASKVYLGENYTDRSPLEYLQRGIDKPIMHPNTYALLEELLTMLAECGEDATFAFVKQEIVQKL